MTGRVMGAQDLEGEGQGRVDEAATCSAECTQQVSAARDLPHPPRSEAQWTGRTSRNGQRLPHPHLPRSGGYKPPSQALTWGRVAGGAHSQLTKHAATHRSSGRRH